MRPPLAAALTLAATLAGAANAGPPVYQNDGPPVSHDPPPIHCQPPRVPRMVTVYVHHYQQRHEWRCVLPRSNPPQRP
jgi:hypothetical protein